jgi:glycine/D-amino acid oxidase-like deaminating enzyme
MFETVDEIAGVLEREGIDADFVKGGHLAVALDDAQAARLRERVGRIRAQGIGDADVRELDRVELAQRVRLAGARLATYSPHAARVHPAKLLRGLRRPPSVSG